MNHLTSNSNTISYIYDFALKYISDGIIIWDREFNCLYANKVFQDFFGALGEFDVNHKIQLSCQSCFADILNKWIRRSEDVLKSGSVSEFQDYEKINNTDLYTETVLIPIFDASQQAFAVILLFRNVTDKHRIQQELNLSSKLAELGKTLAYLSHEIKTPLNSITMNIDMLSEGLVISEHKKKSIFIIKQELRRINKTIREVLKFTRTNNCIGSSVNILSLLNNINQLILPELRGKNISLIYNVKDCVVFGNEQEMESIFLELIKNSIDSIGNNGTIEIYSKNNSLMDNKIRIYIKDSGCGISEPEKIFLPFYTTKKEGNGIGLSQITKSMERLNSSISLVSSEPGCTIFELIFNIKDVNG